MVTEIYTISGTLLRDKGERERDADKKGLIWDKDSTPFYGFYYSFEH